MSLLEYSGTLVPGWVSIPAHVMVGMDVVWCGVTRLGFTDTT